LQRHLQQQLDKDGAPLSNITLTQQTVQGGPPSSLTGVRKAYWKALDAHTSAQAKYDALRAELYQLKNQKTSISGQTETRAVGTTSEDYVALLRQREKHRKLKVIDDALSRITADNEQASANNLDDMVKKKIGELPVPPSTQPTISRDPDVEAKVVELKKAVVSTKRRVDQHRKQAADRDMQNDGEVSAEAEVAGLQKALQVLTIWMEDKLTVIAETEADQQDTAVGAGQGDTTNGTCTSVQDIDAQYERYLEARQRLVQYINEFATSEPHASIGDTEWLVEHGNSRNTNATQALTKTAAATILPFIPALTAAKAEEQSMIQQNALVRRQLSNAEDDTARLVQRLADESHLVQPGASQGKHWAEAATEAGKATNDSISQRLQAGEAFASSAKESHYSIKALPESLTRLSKSES
jgi:hypothetical protein